MKTFLVPLSSEEEFECLTQVEQGNPDAKEKLILHNMRLVAHVAKKYGNSQEDPEDLISIGTIGLIKAVSTFNKAYGSRFATYAIRCIENEMLMYFRSRKKTRNEVSLYEPIGTDKEGNQIHLFDIMDSGTKDILEKLECVQYQEKLKRNMKKVLSTREYKIITRRFGICGEQESTQREIAASIGISRSYVSRIEKKALQKLKKMLENP